MTLMDEAFDVYARQVDEMLNRVCGIDEVALAREWMNKFSVKVPAVGELPLAPVRGTDGGQGGGSPTARTARHLIAVPKDVA